MIDIIVPVWNCLDKTKKFIESLSDQDNFNLIVIDNGSDKETKDFLSTLFVKLDSFNLISNKENLGYVKAVNQGLEISQAPIILLANNDIILPKKLLVELEKSLNVFDIVAPLTNNSGSRSDTRLIEFDGCQDIDCINDFASNLYNNVADIKEVDFVYGHCMMMKREVVKRIGFLDERFGIGNYDDVDFCMRAKEAGFRIGLCMNLFVFHFCHSTFNELGLDVNKIIAENANRYRDKWSRK